MRKMYSENQIKDIVNKGIEDGSIHADPSTEVKVSDINAESSTLGQVIISDGEGGAEWGSISAGMEIVELSSTFGTLTDEQFTKVSGNNCLIKYSYYIFYKFLESDNTITYECANLELSSGKLKEKKFLITKSTKSYNYSDDGLMNSVSANPTLVGTEASLTAIKVGNTSYKVGSEVVAYEGTSLLPTDVVFSGWTLHRAIKDGNILWVVLSGKITNNSSALKSISGIFSITLPSSISSKIYRTDGTTCDSSYSSSALIIQQNTFTGVGSKVIALNSQTANKIDLNIYSYQLNDGASDDLDIRIPLFLDIGTVQQ